MANQYYHIYGGNPTAGAVDGTMLSDGDSELSPLTVSLDASKNESKIEKLAIRCEQGYSANSGTIITAVGETKNCWSFSEKADGTFTPSLTLRATAFKNDINLNP